MGKESGGKQKAFDAGRFFQLVPDLLCRMSSRGVLLQLNDAWLNHLGYSSPELVGTSLCRLVHQEDKASTEREMARLRSGQRSVNFINRLRSKSGEWLWMEWNASPAEDGAVYAVVRNITRRMQAAQRTRLLTDAFRHCTHGLAIENPVSGEILACNPAFAALHGRTAEEMQGMRLFDFYPDFEMERLNASLRLAVDTGFCRFESLKRRRNDELFPLQIDFVFVRDEHGGPLYLIVTAEDITERRRAEAALRESEGRFRAVVESAPEGIFIQLGGLFSYLNPAALRMFGASGQDEMLGRPVVEQLHPEHRERVRALIKKLNEEEVGLPFPEERRFIRCDGTYFTADVSAVPFVQGGEKGALVFVHDTSEPKRAEGERLRLELELFHSQKMESIGRLAGGVAHDLNNLLTPILGYAELLDGQFGPNDERLDDVRAIHSAGVRARDLVRQLLAFSRRQSLEFSVIDLNAAVSGFLPLLQRTLQDDIEIDEMLAGGELLIEGDIGQVEQVMMNLAVNAQDAMPEGGRLSIRTGIVPAERLPRTVHDEMGEADCVALTFVDSGEGMDSQTMEQIFEPFFTTKEKGSGTGLGLATVYGIARQHNGMVDVTSEPGKGSAFTLYFPRFRGERPREESQSRAEPASIAAGYGSVLVVEDNEVVRAFIVDALRHFGYRVLAADGARAALAVIDEKGGCPDLLLTDIVMPGMDGRELSLEACRKCPAMRVLYMSGYASKVLERETVTACRTGYLHKPFSVKELLDAVSALIAAPEGKERKIKKPKPKM